jgi:hypothetical protein
MTFEHWIVIAAAPAELFALTQDYSRRLQWDPFLKSAELLGGAMAAGVGVRAFCVAHSGLGMETEYVSFNPPRTCAVKMTRGPQLIGSFAGSWRFEEIRLGQTRVGFRYHVRARPFWLSWIRASAWSPSRRRSNSAACWLGVRGPPDSPSPPTPAP